MALQYPILASKLKRFENVDRVVHSDPSGGTIIRSFYFEPYSAYPLVLTALRGTIALNPALPTVGGVQGYQRVKPHQDPYQRQFYCNDAKCIPMNREAINGCRNSGFDPTANLDDGILGAGNSDYNKQLFSCRAAMDNIDDFDFANNPDLLAAGDIANSNWKIPLNNLASSGSDGGYVVATYNPLISIRQFASGGDVTDPFDYVIREQPWQNETLLTQTGRQLFTLSPQNFPNPAVYTATQSGGLTDTFAKPEVVWRFRIWRLMVPFLPKFTIELFTNKLNGGTYQTVQYLGNLPWGMPFIANTARLEHVEPEMTQGPDGSIWWNLRLDFMVRKLWDEYYDERQEGQGKQKGWIGWNHHFCIPTLRTWTGIDTGLSAAGPGYYPVVWNSGVFQSLGNDHPLFLFDTDVDMKAIPFVQALGNGLGQGLFLAPFQAGFYSNQ